MKIIIMIILALLLISVVIKIGIRIRQYDDEIEHLFKEELNKRNKEV